MRKTALLVLVILLGFSCSEQKEVMPTAPELTKPIVLMPDLEYRIRPMLTKFYWTSNIPNPLKFVLKRQLASGDWKHIQEIIPERTKVLYSGEDYTPPISAVYKVTGITIYGESYDSPTVFVYRNFQGDF